VIALERLKRLNEVDPMAAPFWRKIFPHSRTALQPRVIVDSSAFDPGVIHKSGRAVVLMAQDKEDCIYEWVKQEMQNASGVVVLDLQSADATPYYAAQAGAVVVLQNQGVDLDDALGQAIDVARQFSEHIEVIER
jgi:hypothetical protein